MEIWTEKVTVKRGYIYHNAKDCVVYNDPFPIFLSSRFMITAIPRQELYLHPPLSHFDMFVNVAVSLVI